MAGRYGEDYLQLFVEEGDWYDRIVLGTLLPGWAWKSLPRPGRAWLRNYISGVLLYFVSSFLWCFYIYYLKRNVYVPKDGILSNKAMLLQILVAMKSMPFNSVVPTLSEYMIQRGWTRCFSSISDVGFAFHPLDGILQALPQVITLFLVPAHLMTHMVLFFCEGVWITNIHDCIHGQVWPMMGAGYHTIHHTTYCHNYGHYTILMDWMFGTLHRPEEDLKKGS